MNDLAEKIRDERTKCIGRLEGYVSDQYIKVADGAFGRVQKIVEEHDPWTPADTPPKRNRETYEVTVRESSGKTYSSVGEWQDGEWLMLHAQDEHQNHEPCFSDWGAEVIAWKELTPPKEAE